MQKSQNCFGFSLVELMASLSIISILIAIVYPSYHRYVQKARLYSAYQALLNNAHILERHYANQGNFKKNSTNWIDLPITQTEFFCIKLQGNPKGTENDSAYSLKAVAWDKKSEPRVLSVNQDGLALLCKSSTSDCSEDKFFKNPNRSDSECETFM
ncbi:type IV pilin protein [Kingella negevensis]|uniref:type IV pilin protein n=1 Tax=Kingella negevensis TaxID=1522312 RepID=UPI00050A1678|nr:type IV pilin protein [Kingella negevensis]MDK4687733.1 type IV pilin protein [Kingella negevensis]WII91272.1 type IV pilin protein [Kingella negevensis]